AAPATVPGEGGQLGPSLPRSGRRPGEVPVLGADRRLRFGGAGIDLGAPEGRLVAALLRRPGSWCSRATLAEAGWPGLPEREALARLDGRLLVLARRRRPLGLRVLAHPDRGAVLEPLGAPVPAGA